MRDLMGYFPSANGINRIAYYVYLPNCKPKCIVQIAHGMCENGIVYRGVARYLTNRGCIVCAADSLGHGRSVRGYDDVGFFAPKNGWRCVVRDMKTLTDRMTRRFPHLPVFLVGHSMGSFAAREYLTWYGETLAGCVLVGTSDGFEAQKLLIGLARLLCLYREGKFHVPGILNCGCLLYNAKMGRCSAGWDWLSRDPRIREMMERHCFDYTARAYFDIVTLLDTVSADDWAYSVPEELPILLMSGGKDPVGNCGRGVARLYRRLKEAGRENVKVRIYAGARHMLLHETNRKQVCRDLYDWIARVLIERNRLAARR